MIRTVVGNGTPVFAGDGGPAINASLTSPVDVAVDAAGSLFIADGNNFRIRQVTSDGTIRTFAGTESSDALGDKIPARDAHLFDPFAVALDAAGNLYVADTRHDRIRRVSADGVIEIVAGNENSGFSGDGGPATKASLNFPAGLAADALGNLYIADTGNNRVRRLSPDGIISTVAGNGNQGYSGDGGPATSASLEQPYGLAVDGAGNLFIADKMNERIRRVTRDGVIRTVAGNGNRGTAGDGGPATEASLDHPRSVVVDSAGNLFIADAATIRRVTPDGIIRTIAGRGIGGFSGDGGPASNATLTFPEGLALDDGGNLFIADSGQ